MTNNDERDTKYVKGSQRVTPTKSKHAHEYIRPYAMMYLRRFDGTVTEEKYKFSLPAQCVECGYTRRQYIRDALEVEVSPEEYRRMKGNNDKKED